MTVSFTVSKEEAFQIREIAKRALAMSKDDGINYPYMDIEMDLTAVHANGCPINLPKMLTAEYNDFGHDIYGIRRYIDRKTGTLTNCFQPRCSR